MSNKALKIKTLVTIVRSDNCNCHQYERAINLLMILDSEIAKNEIDSHYLRSASKFSVCPDFKKVG